MSTALRHGLCALALLAGAAGCRTAPEAPPEPGSLHVQVMQATVREDRNGLSPTVALLPYGLAVRPCATNADWYRVQVDGWVHRSALRRGPLSTNSLSPADFDAWVDAVLEHLTNTAKGARLPAVNPPSASP